MEKYNYVSFDNFCYEFGYDNDSIKAKKTYDSCIELYLKLISIFSQEEIEVLKMIQ